MNVFAKGFGLTVAAVIGALLLGLTEVASGVGLVGLLLTVLFGAVSGGRVQTRSGTRGARSFRQLGRYSDLDGDVMAGGLIGGLSAAVVAELLGLKPAAAVVGILVIGAGFGLSASVRAVVSLAGAVAALAELFGAGSCGIGVDVTSIVAAVGAVAVVGVAMVVVAKGLFGVATPLRRRQGPAERLLALAGLIELATFVGRPFGVSIWGDAPGGARWLVAGLLVVIGVGVGFGSRLVLGLISVALAAATVWVVVSDVGAGAACGPSVTTLGLALAFVAAAATASAVSA